MLIMKLEPGLDRQLDWMKNTYNQLRLTSAKNRHCLLVGQVQRGKTNMMKLMLHTLSNQDSGFIAIFDSFDRGLASFSQEDECGLLGNERTVGGMVN